MNKSEIRKIEEARKILVPNRVDILNLLVKEKTCVCMMVKKLKIKHNLISHHLKVLLDMGIIKSERKGQHIIYELIEKEREKITLLLNLIKN